MTDEQYFMAVAQKAFEQLPFDQLYRGPQTSNVIDLANARARLRPPTGLAATLKTIDDAFRSD